MTDKPKKEMIAKSAGTYKGFTLFQTKYGFVALVGMSIISGIKKSDLEKEIDRYLLARLN